MRAYERFLHYAKVNTQSAEGTGKSPSTDCQWELARLLEIVERRCWEERQADFPHVRERFLEEEKRHAEQEPQPEKKGGE